MSELTGIVYTNAESLCERTFISDITQTESPLYEPGAIVPDVQLFRTTPDMLEPLQASPSTPVGGSIELIRFSVELQEALTAPSVREISPTLCPPGMPTTTRNTENENLYTGLHLDSKQNLPLRNRLSSDRRIGLNMGPGHRFLLVGTVDAFDIADELGISEHDTVETPHGRSLFEKEERPSMRCLWLLLRAGEGYVAPTENILHDGSTYGAEGPSTIRFWIGTWEQGACGSVV